MDGFTLTLSPTLIVGEAFTLTENPNNSTCIKRTQYRRFSRPLKLFLPCHSTCEKNYIQLTNTNYYFKKLEI